MVHLDTGPAVGRIERLTFASRESARGKDDLARLWLTRSIDHADNKDSCWDAAGRRISRQKGAESTQLHLDRFSGFEPEIGHGKMAEIMDLLCIPTPASRLPERSSARR